MPAFLEIDQKRYLAAGVYLSEAPDPLHPPVTHCMTEYPCPVHIHTGKEGRGIVNQ